MKKAWIILSIVMLAIVLAGCSGTAAIDPIVGTWRDQYLGAAQIVFSDNQQLYVSILDSAYEGNWSKVDADHYKLDYVELGNNTSAYSAIVDYDQTNGSISMENNPNIQYLKIIDKIQGNWTDQLKTSSMQFAGDNSWSITGNNSSYYGNWSRVNNTIYLIQYSDVSNKMAVYRELVFYNQSYSVIQLDNLTYIFYTRVL